MVGQIDLQSDNAPTFRRNRSPSGRSPRDTLKVVERGSKRPRNRRFRLGFELVSLDELGIKFKLQDTRLKDTRLKAKSFPRASRP